jgi:hypothetical protein
VTDLSRHTPARHRPAREDGFLTIRRLRLASDATVISSGLDPPMRIGSYSGTGRLWRFEPEVQVRAVAEAFRCLSR